MSTKIFVNLPVKDLKKSMAFFEALGFSFNKQFTNDDAACMVISEHNYAMLLTHAYFNNFSDTSIPDAHNSTEMQISLALVGNAADDEMVAKKVEAGGKEPRPKQDHGFMVQRTFEEHDGHTW